MLDAIKNGKKLKSAKERKVDKKKAEEQRETAPKSTGTPMLDALNKRMTSMRKGIDPKERKSKTDDADDLSMPALPKYSKSSSKKSK